MFVSRKIPMTITVRALDDLQVQASRIEYTVTVVLYFFTSKITANKRPCVREPQHWNLEHTEHNLRDELEFLLLYG